jgi:hypothetical protein
MCATDDPADVAPVEALPSDAEWKGEVLPIEPVDICRYAQRLTGVGQPHAVIGGLQLTGPLFEPIIDDTVRALERLAPDLIFPARCTGWRATHAIARRLSGAFIQNNVGTAFHLTGRIREACGQDALVLARITGGAPA